MRILQVSSARTFGGGERHVADLSRELIARGHEVFAAIRPTSEWRENIDFIPDERLLYVSIRNSFGALSAKKIAAFIRENKIDIVHAHVARDYVPSSLACVISRQSKLVLTRHVVFPLKPFNKLVLKNVSAAIAVSTRVSDDLKNIFPKEKVHIISNGIDVDHWFSADKAATADEFKTFHSIPKDAKVISAVGELKILKGQRDLILAANEIVKQDQNVFFAIVGKDNTFDKAYRRELKRLVAVFGLEEKFLWLDWVNDTAPLLAATDIFVSPSHSESFGLSILEAMAAGLPIVATDTDGAKELTDGIITTVPIKDALAIKDAVISYLNDADKMRSVGDALKKRAAERFSINKMLDSTERLYSTIVDNGGPN